MNTVPLFSSPQDAWNTPPDLVREIAVFLGTIDLDPCPDAAHAIPATHHAIGDGLMMPWQGRVYVNSPYGRQIGRWVTKALTEPVSELVLLVPARVDTS
jgi:site-specific DNA-methyltransferase (adenine-specific)